jgi:hypothetical protein
VVEHSDSFMRVNVKIATVRQDRRAISYVVSRAQPNSMNPDRYLVWLMKHNQFVELPGDFLAVKKTRRLTADMLHQLTQGAAPQ